MSNTRLFILAIFVILAIAFVRMLERPEDPEDPLGRLFREETADVDPLIQAACTAVQTPLKELLEAPFELAYEPPAACRMTIDASPPDAERKVRALFDAMQWESVAERRVRRGPAACLWRTAGGDTLVLECRLVDHGS